MMNNKLFGIMMAMLLLVVTMVSATGLDIEVDYEKDYLYNTTINPTIFAWDENGLLAENITCEYNYNLTELQTTIGTHDVRVYCYNETVGGSTTFSFDVAEKTAFGIWKPVDNWTFPIIYLVLTILLLILAFAYESQMMGVLGSIMLIMAYFIIGATSPILFAPVLIVGFLLAFKFATL
jgi:membrane-bound ClpP family serine protease